jgi:small-conductance mechanosensitive channel
MSKRPGGLTALAVLNFVFGGLAIIAIFALLALFSVADAVAKEVASDVPNKGALSFIVLLSVASAGLLIASGVGYLGQKRFLGRTLGNAYAAVSIGSTGLALVLLPVGFGISDLIGLIYPVLTLILLNTTFKEDLVN